MRVHAILALLLVAGLAGCTQSDGGGPMPPRVAEARVEVVVEDAETRAPLAGADVLLTSTSGDHLSATTDADGRASFTLQPPIACSVTVELAGYRTTGQSVSCRASQTHTILLQRRTFPLQPQPTPPTPAEPQPVAIEGVVYAIDGHRLSGVEVVLDDGHTTTTTRDGAFHFTALPGQHVLAVAAGCWGSATFPIKVTAPVAIDLHLTILAAPLAAPELRAVPGAGASRLLTLAWSDVPNATHFEVYRNEQPFHALGHSLAYSVHDASAADNFTVAAIDACGQLGVPSNATAGLDQPAAGFATVPHRVPLPVQVEEHSYPSSAGARAWRTVAGTGSASGNYVAVTPDGWILDNAAGRLAISKDEGRTWTSLAEPPRSLGGGAVTIAPDGDVAAFDASGGELGFSYRYSATTRSWAMLPVAVPPGFAQPYLATLKGPFAVQDRLAAYACIVQGATAVLVSFDCLTYAPITLNTAVLAAVPTLNLTRLTSLADANRDWTSPIGAFAAVAIDNGLGVLDPRDDGLGATEPTAALHGSLPWRGVQLPAVPGSILRVDAAGTLHALAFNATSSVVAYSWSHDSGATWTTARRDVGGRVLHADLRVNAAQDQAVAAVHVATLDGHDAFRVLATLDGHDAFRVLRWRDLEAPRFVEELDVGDGNHSRLIPTQLVRQTMEPRFDVLGFGLLPSGKVVVSFVDSEHPASALAIEV